MTRREAIDIIAAHYPADDDNEATAEIGRRLLREARIPRPDPDWRDEPDDVLIRYARLCLEESDRQFAASERWAARKGHF